MGKFSDIALGLLAAFIAVLAPIHSILIVTGVLISVDAITGIWASLKLKSPEVAWYNHISSAKLRSTISKMIIYHIAIISGFLLEKYLLDSSVPVAKIVSSTIGFVEFKSILENVTIISGKDILAELLKKLNSPNLK